MSSERAQFRALLARLAATTQAKIPALNGRVEKAVKLVLGEDVHLNDDGSATVASGSEAARSYVIKDGQCTCRDWQQAPEHLCAHRFASGLLRKVQTLLPAADQGDTITLIPPALPEAPLPEAACSVNTFIEVQGRRVQVTLRGHNDVAVLTRLEHLLAQYPQTDTPGSAEGFCAKHGVHMRWNPGRDGKSGWWSHHLGEKKYCHGK